MVPLGTANYCRYRLHNQVPASTCTNHPDYYKLLAIVYAVRIRRTLLYACQALKQSTRRACCSMGPTLYNSGALASLDIGGPHNPSEPTEQVSG